MVLVTASEFITQSLVDAGVRTVYGGHGGALVPLVNAVVDHPELRWVVTRNEANASLMAAADAKLHGTHSLAACIATSGPGASNLLTGLLDAQLDRVGVIAITGTKPRADAGHSEFQDIDQARLFAAGGLAFSVTVSDSLQLVSILRDAVAIALTQRVCVHVAVPVDIQGEKIMAPAHLCSARPREIARRVEGQLADKESLAAVAKLLASPAERVVFAIGLEARDEGDAILALAETVCAPVVTRLDAKGSVNEAHPLVFGVIGVHGKPGLEIANVMIESATLVVAFGVTDLTVLLCDSHGLQVRRLVEVVGDSFGVATRFRAEHTLVSMPNNVCRQLTERLADLVLTDFDPSLTDRRTPVSEEATELWSSLKRRVEEHATMSSKAGRPRGASQPRYVIKPNAGNVGMSRAGYVHPARLLSALGKYLGERDVVTIDTGDVTLWASMCLSLFAHTVTLSSERLGTMGYALCAGIAASLTRGPDAHVVVIAGDGGFQMTLSELATAMQHRLRLTIIVFDNGVLGRVEFGFKDAKGCAITGCDWVALAKAYGADGVALDNEDDIDEALTAALDAPGVFIIGVRTDPMLKADMAKVHDTTLPVWLEGPVHTVDSG